MKHLRGRVAQWPQLAVHRHARRRGSTKSPGTERCTTTQTRWGCVSKFAQVWTDLRQARAGCHAGTGRSPGGQQRPRKRTIEPVVERHPDRKPMRHADAVGTPISGQASRRADTRSAAGTRAGAKPWLHHSLPCTVHTCARRSRLLPADKHNLIRQIARAART